MHECLERGSSTVSHEGLFFPSFPSLFRFFQKLCACACDGMSDAFDRNTNFGSWDKLGSRYYRKFEVYQMSWGTDVDLSTSIAVAAPYGGPLGLSRQTTNKNMEKKGKRFHHQKLCVRLQTAITRDPSKLVAVSGATNKPIVFLYSLSGKLLGRFAVCLSFFFPPLHATLHQPQTKHTVEPWKNCARWTWLD